VYPPVRQHGTRRQQHVLPAKYFRAGKKAFAHGVSTVQDAMTNSEFAMFEKQHAGFQHAILTNQNGRHASVAQGVGGDEVFRICGEVIFLTALPAQLLDCRNQGAQCAFAEDQFRGSCADFKPRLGGSARARGKVSYRFIDIQSS
jgi:hypothetical protein